MLRASVAQAFRPEDFSCGGMVGGGARSLIPKGMSYSLASKSCAGPSAEWLYPGAFQGNQRGGSDAV